MQIFLNILLVILSITIIVSIMLQPSKTDGFTSLISGGSENFFSKNKIKTYESTLVRVTVVSSVLFAAVVIGLNMV